MTTTITTKRAHRTSAELDQLRARALGGDWFKDLSDADREWVWRSTLKGVRRAEAMRLAGLRDEQIEHALAMIRCRYDQRIAAYKKRQATKAMQPKVVRKVAPATTPPARRGVWPFGRR